MSTLHFFPLKNLHFIFDREVYFFYSTPLWFESQNNILKTMILFFVKSTVFFSIVLMFSGPQTAHAITSENLFQLADSRLTQFLATHCDCSKQNNPRQFSWTRVQRLTQVPSEIECTRRFAAVFVHAKAKRIKTFCCYATIEKTKVFCAEGAFGKVERHDRVEWNTNCIPLPKELDPMKRENVIQKLIKRMVLNWNNICTMVPSILLVDWVF